VFRHSNCLHMHLALMKFLIWFRFYSFIVSRDWRLGADCRFSETLGTVLLFWDDTAYRLNFSFSVLFLHVHVAHMHMEYSIC
jgi:hypothetical protein